MRTIMTYMGLSALGLALVGCGGKQSPVQPKDLKVDAGQECSPEKLKGDSEPFIVAWDEDSRANLEYAMGSGVVLVGYTCEGIKVIDTCTVEGSYAYRGLQMRTKTVQIEDKATLDANFGGAGLPGTLSTSMGQGRALNLSTVVMGASSTTAPMMTRDMLKGSGCEKVTHFVRMAKMGAFAMDTASKGEIKAAGEMFGYGSASGAASSSKSTAIVEGSLQSCKEGKREKGQPVDGCAVPLKVTLRPIAAATQKGQKPTEASSNKGTVDVRGCPDGFVLVDDICQKPKADTVSLCKKGDVEGCKTNCSKGNLPSCGRFSNVLLQKYFDDFMAEVSNKNEVKSLVGNLAPKLKQACDEELEGDACTLYAYTLVLDSEAAKPSGPDYDDSTKANLAEYVKYVEEGCSWGEPIGCTAVYTTYIDGFYADDSDDAWGDMAIAKNPAKALSMLDDACDYGSARTCMYLSDYYDDFTSKPDEMKKVVPYLAKACDGLQARACYLLGVWLLDADTCVDVSMKFSGGFLNKDPLVSDNAYEIDYDDASDIKDAKEYYTERCNSLGGIVNKEVAMTAFKRGCEWDFDIDANDGACKAAEYLNAK